MPVSATSEKDILRVSFSPEGESEVPHRYEAEIVCFLKISANGLEIKYSHHIFHARPSTTGPFTEETIRRMPLTSSLIAVIEHGVFYEFWNTFTRSVQISPAPVGKIPTEANSVSPG